MPASPPRRSQPSEPSDPDDYSNCSKVYVGDLGNYARESDVEGAFGPYGPLRSVWVARRPPGFAFVMFEDPRDAADAVKAMDGKTLCGRQIRCQLSHGKSRWPNGRPPTYLLSRPAPRFINDGPKERSHSHSSRSSSRSRSSSDSSNDSRRSRSRSSRKRRRRSHSHKQSRRPRPTRARSDRILPARRERTPPGLIYGDARRDADLEAALLAANGAEG